MNIVLYLIPTMTLKFLKVLKKGLNILQKCSVVANKEMLQAQLRDARSLSSSMEAMQHVRYNLKYPNLMPPKESAPATLDPDC